MSIEQLCATYICKYFKKNQILKFNNNNSALKMNEYRTNVYRLNICN